MGSPRRLTKPYAQTVSIDDAELVRLIREHALLEGDFVLRSGRRSNYYLDKYRLETNPRLLGALGQRVAEVVLERAPESVRLAGPELGAVALAAAASLASGLPFLIVRKEAKEYGTAERIEGTYEPGEDVCLVEDIVTTGGAAASAVEALRDAGLVCRKAVCIVDREEGGQGTLERHDVQLFHLFRAVEIVGS